MEVKYKDMIVTVDVLNGPSKASREYPGYNAEFRIISAYRLNNDEIDYIELDMLKRDMFFIEQVNIAYEESLKDREYEPD